MAEARPGAASSKNARPRSATRHLAPRLRRPRLIALTPLVDVVFLLLTFFMLSSDLSPFGRLPFSDLRQSTATGGASPGKSSGADILLSVDAGRVRLDGTPVAAGDLLAALRGARGKGAESVAIVTAPGATVQDLVGALAAARSAAFASIAIVDMR